MGHASALQILACGVGQLGVDFEADHTFGACGQQGGQVATARANVEHFFVTRQLQVVHQARVHTWRDHLLTMTQWNVGVGVGQGLVGGGHEQLTRHI